MHLQLKSFVFCSYYACFRIRGKQCSFFRKFGVLCFLVTPFLRFVVLRYYRQLVLKKAISSTETFLFELKIRLTQNKTKLNRPTILMNRQIKYLFLLMSYIPHDAISQKGLLRKAST